MTRGFQRVDKVDGVFVLADTDAAGWPSEDCQLTLFDLRNYVGNQGDPADPNPPDLDIDGLYRGRFTGQAGRVLLPASDAEFVSLEYDAATNTTTFEIDYAASEFGRPYFALRFLDTRRTPGSPLGSGITDLRVVRPGYALDTDQRFTDVWLDAIAPFSVHRYMGWSETNDDGVFTDPDNLLGPVEVDWADRIEVARADAATTLQGPLAEDQGIAWETIIEHINLNGKDAWVNIPVQASDDYIRELARLFAQELDPGIKLYLEYSNEVWNYSFPQWNWNYEKAKQEAAAGSVIAADGSNNDNLWAARRFAKRTVEMGQIFVEEGVGQIGGRVRPILTYFASNPGNLAAGSPYLATEAMIDFIVDTYGAPADYIHAVARTGYFGAGKFQELPEGASVQEILDALAAGIPTDYGLFGQLADRYGIDFAVYEGAPGHRVGYETNLANRIAAERTEALAKILQKSIIDAFFPNSGDLYMYFATHQFYTKYGFWGTTDIITDLNRDFKYRALLDIINGTNLDRQPIIGTGELPIASTGVPYEATIDVYGGDAPLSTSLAGDLPGGLSISGTSITGTPTQAGTFEVTVEVTDADGDADERSFTLTVNDVVTVPALAAAVAVDGSVDAAWGAVPSLTLGNRIRGTISGASDFAASAKVAWDANALYFLVDVTDEALVTDSDQRYEDDGVEVYLDIGNDKSSTYGPDDYQLVFRYGDAVDEVSSGPPVPGLRRADAARPGGYVVEVAIPWVDLDVDPAQGVLIGFDIHAADDDDGDGRDAKLSYSALTDDSYRDPQTFGTGVLTGVTTGGGGDSDAEYVILRNRQTGLSMRPAGGGSDQAIEVATADGSDEFLWRRVPTSDGYFYLENKATGLYFRPATEDLGAVMLTKPSSWSGNWTQWRLDDVGGDSDAFFLVNRNNGTHLRPASNSNPTVVQQPSTWRGAWTQWYLDPAATGGGDPGEVVRLRHVNSGELLYPEAAGVGSTVAVGDDDGTDRFTWSIVPAADGNVLLRSEAYGTYASATAAEDFAPVETSSDAGAASQWTITATGSDGDVRITVPSTGNQLSPVSGSDRNTRLSPSDWGGTFLNWTIEPVSGAQTESRAANAGFGPATEITISPNPASDYLAVALTGEGGESTATTAEFTIVDPIGRVVSQGRLPIGATVDIDLLGFGPGIYTLDAGRYGRTRFIKR